MPPST
jgi:hypothetical protein